MMDINDILQASVDLFDEVKNTDQLTLLETKLKDLVKAKKEQFKAEVKAAEKANKDLAKATIRDLLTDADVGKYVKYTYGSGKDKTTRIGKVVRAPSAEHPTFSVEADDGKGGVKKLPRNASAFIGFASEDELTAAGITVAA